MTVTSLDPRVLRFAGDLAARIVRAREAIQDGDLDFADSILYYAEQDLDAWRAWVGEWVESTTVRRAA